MEEKTDNSFLVRNETSQKIESKKKITIIVDEDDPCLKREEKKIEEVAFPEFRFNPGVDPRYIHIIIQDTLKINSESRCILCVS